jgi:uncharacterized protein YcbK (DUF882 family)
MGDLSKNLSRWEFACPDGCGFDTVDAELVNVLQDVRAHFNKAINITSGCRCEEHNKDVDGTQGSTHLYGKAADFWVTDTSPDEVANYLERKYIGRYGIGRYNGRTHIDVRSNGPARWDKRG